VGSITVAESLLKPLLSAKPSDNRLYIDCLSLLGRLEKDRYARELNSANKKVAAARSAAAYGAAYKDSGDYYPGANAATMLLLSGDTEGCRAIVESVLPECTLQLQDGKTEDPWLAATLGELMLLKGEVEEAKSWYQQAAQLMGSALGNIASMRRQLRLLAATLPQASALLEVLSIPTVATVTGHMIDHPDAKTVRFPTDLIPLVSENIHAYLQQHNIGLGYCSVACGVDILFAEAILNRGGEVHVYLPFDKDDFIATSAAFAGQDWITRLEAVLEKATSVRYATNENYLGDDLLFSYNADVITGRMLLRAERLEVKPRFLAVYDFNSAAPAGGSRATADSWEMQGFEVDRMDLSQLRDTLSECQNRSIPVATKPLATSTTRREIHAMVFADIVGFSKLGEADTPHFFVGLLNAIAELIEKHKAGNEFSNTWGDGLFLVFNELPQAAAFALDLRDLVNDTDWTKRGLPATTNIRIALHVGPVYPAEDPILKCRNFFGSHVNQTARMEPITSPGSVFVSDQAAALIRFHATDKFACDYLGPAALPKDAGTIGLHRLRRRTEIE
jgi:class 3 adenylate cyclase